MTYSLVRLSSQKILGHDCLRKDNAAIIRMNGNLPKHYTSIMLLFQLYHTYLITVYIGGTTDVFYAMSDFIVSKTFNIYFSFLFIYLQWA